MKFLQDIILVYKDCVPFCYIDFDIYRQHFTFEDISVRSFCVMLILYVDDLLGSFVFLI